MNRTTLILILCAFSVGLNIFLGSLILGQRLGQSRAEPSSLFRAVTAHIETLPEAQKQSAQAILEAAREELRAAAKDAKAQRKALLDYIKSPSYERMGAEKRLQVLKKKNLVLQGLSQKAMLDIADVLDARQRAEFLEKNPAE